LPAQEQRLLEAASVAGLEFSTGAVAAALGSPEVEVEEQCLRLAEQRQFLRTVGAGEWPDGTPASRFAFLHSLHRDLWQERVGAKRSLGIRERSVTAATPPSPE
jgi:hypothetical protein